MNTKFIKGTNKKYSIREDGKVFCNYKINKKGVKYLTNKEVKSSLVITKLGLKYMSISLYISENIRKTFTLKQLMSNHFNVQNKKKGSREIYCIDGDPTNCSVKNLRHKDKWDRKKQNESTKNYRKMNPLKAKESQLKSDLKSRLIIDRRYVRNIFSSYGIKILAKDIPDYLVKLKRHQLKLHREIKQQLKT